MELAKKIINQREETRRLFKELEASIWKLFDRQGVDKDIVKKLNKLNERLL